MANGIFDKGADDTTLAINAVFAFSSGARTMLLWSNENSFAIRKRTMHLVSFFV